MIDLQPLGDRAFLASFKTEAEAARWAGAVRASGLPGVLDVSLAYASAAVYADPDRVKDWDAWARSLRILADGEGPDLASGRVLRIPVWYGGDDLGEVARAIGATEAEVVALHSGQDYRVFAVGFQPGFPYAGYLPERLSGIPRRSSPRARVPAGSVAIAGRQTGIYPGESPGGWHLLGRTPCRVVDVEAGVFPIEPGDLLRFEPIAREAFEERRNRDVWPVEASLGRLEKFCSRTLDDRSTAGYRRKRKVQFLDFPLHLYSSRDKFEVSSPLAQRHPAIKPQIKNLRFTPR